MCELDYDPPSVYSETRPKARKEHRCDECRATIAIGTVHRKVFGIWDGHIETYRYCRKCSRLMALMDAAKEPYYMDQLRESLQECIREHGDGVVKRMQTANRQGVGKEWRGSE